MKTEIVFVLDRSGSMNGLQKDVIGGFNSFVNEQKKLKDKANITVILFDDQYEILVNDLPLEEMYELTEKEYFVRGWTALLDAVGKAINTVKVNIKKKDRVIFIINTDGLENSSVEFKKDQIKNMVEELEKTKKWKFIFFGANIDSFAEGNSIGIAFTWDFLPNQKGMESVYACTSDLVANYRQVGDISPDTYNQVNNEMLGVNQDG